jgi:hypothetical protein
MTAALRSTQTTPNLRPLGVALAGLLGAGALLAGLAGAQTATSPKAAPFTIVAPVWDHGTSAAALKPALVFDHGTSLIAEPKAETTPQATWDHGTATAPSLRSGGVSRLGYR